ncbi:MAG TPA: Hsp20/alpha crystallin family protein [bacterium]|nr:Hsp20/alpha crystallin family protein [bacterium]
MSLIKWTPVLPDSFDEMDRWFDWPTSKMSFNYAPAIDIWQDQDNVYAECPLAGINPEDVSISIENDVLTIEGKSEKKSEVDERSYYRKEVRYGSFHRVVALPAAVDSEQAKAEYENGVLKVSIPKEAKAKPRTVKVEVK